MEKMTQQYHRISVTTDFLIKVLKIYTIRAKEKEAKKNGIKKLQVTKARVCKDIINDMENARLI